MRAHNFLLIILTLLMVFSCRKADEPEFLGEDPRAIEANSTAALLLEQTSTFDGSYDNILDQASCLALILPVQVRVNGVELTVDTVADYAVVESILDEFDDDTDVVELLFPLTVVQSDFTEVTVADQSAFDALAAACGGENAPDPDIECADMVYPITVSIYDPERERIETETIEDDKDLYELIQDLGEGPIVSLNFPLNIRLSDGTVVQAADLAQLEIILDSARATCDEDDDYDYNDDDCDDCSTDYLTDVLTGCPDWYVDKLELSDADLEDLYAGYLLNFNADGSLTVDSGTGSFTGTWDSSGSANSIVVNINIPSLPDFNNSWNLHEIQESGNARVEFRQPNDDRLRLESTCP